MTGDERFLFDLQGWISIPNALSAEELQQLNALMDRRVEAEMEAGSCRHRFTQLLEWGGPFRNLIDHAAIYPRLLELLGAGLRLDHEYAVVLRKPPLSGINILHGGATPFDATQYYHYNNGEIRNGLMVVAYNLKDVNPGDGGFAVVSGSHKSNIPFPEHWRTQAASLDCVQKVAAPAGTAIIFTEALTHGTLPWTAATERRTLFYKYSPAPLSWASGYYCVQDYPDLTLRQRELLEAPNARYPERFINSTPPE